MRVKNLTYLLITAVLPFCSCSESISDKATEELCDTSQVSYTNTISLIMEANCYRCHSEERYASKGDGVLLEGYDNLKQKIDEGLVYGNMAHLPGFLKMPRKSAQIDSCDIAKVKSWIDAGAPNN